MACGRSGRLTPKVDEARARAIDALFDVTPGESVGMLSALKGFGGCVGITFGWFGEGSSNVHHLIRFASQALADRCWVYWWASPEDAQAHFKAELVRDWGVSRLLVPWSTFGKKTQARALSKNQENMIARSNRAFQTDIGPEPYPSVDRASPRGGRCVRVAFYVNGAKAATRRTNASIQVVEAHA